jgi:hypothetical protein
MVPAELYFVTNPAPAADGSTDSKNGGFVGMIGNSEVDVVDPVT